MLEASALKANRAHFFLRPSTCHCFSAFSALLAVVLCGSITSKLLNASPFLRNAHNQFASLSILHAAPHFLRFCCCAVELFVPLLLLVILLLPFAQRIRSPAQEVKCFVVSESLLLLLLLLLLVRWRKC